MEGGIPVDAGATCPLHRPMPASDIDFSDKKTNMGVVIHSLVQPGYSGSPFSSAIP